MTNFEIHFFKSRLYDFWNARITFKNNAGIETSLLFTDLVYLDVTARNIIATLIKNNL